MTTQIATAQGIGSTSGVFLDEPGSIHNPFVIDWLFTVDGTFNTTTVTLDYTPNGGGTWVEITGSSTTAPGTKVLQLPFGATIRLTVTGGTSPSINAWIN